MKLAHDGETSLRLKPIGFRETGRSKSAIAELTNIYDSESEDDEEFFDAVGAGKVEVIAEMPLTTPNPAPTSKGRDEALGDLREPLETQIAASFKGYEDPVRKCLMLEADDRPKISLWVSPSTQIVLFVVKLVLGNLEIHDRQGHDKNDLACFIQRTYLTHEQGC